MSKYRSGIDEVSIKYQWDIDGVSVKYQWSTRFLYLTSALRALLRHFTGASSVPHQYPPSILHFYLASIRTTLVISLSAIVVCWMIFNPDPFNELDVEVDEVNHCIKQQEANKPINACSTITHTKSWFSEILLLPISDEKGWSMLIKYIKNPSIWTSELLFHSIPLNEVSRLPRLRKNSKHMCTGFEDFLWKESQFRAVEELDFDVEWVRKLEQEPSNPLKISVEFFFLSVSY